MGFLCLWSINIPTVLLVMGRPFVHARAFDARGPRRGGAVLSPQPQALFRPPRAHRRSKAWPSFNTTKSERDPPSPALLLFATEAVFRQRIQRRPRENAESSFGDVEANHEHPQAGSNFRAVVPKGSLHLSRPSNEASCAPIRGASP